MSSWNHRSIIREMDIIPFPVLLLQSLLYPIQSGLLPHPALPSPGPRKQEGLANRYRMLGMCPCFVYYFSWVDVTFIDTQLKFVFLESYPCSSESWLREVNPVHYCAVSVLVWIPFVGSIPPCLPPYLCRRMLQCRRHF